MGFFLFLAQLCRTNKFYVSASVYIALSQFSDPEGQRFESSRSHQEQHLMGCCSFCFAWILWSSKRGGFEQPVPRALRPAGQKRPGGAFLGRGSANPFGRTRKPHCDVFFAMRFLFLLVFDFQNNFSSISSAASVYCPFPRRSFLSLFIVIRIR